MLRNIEEILKKPLEITRKLEENLTILEESLRNFVNFM